MRKVKETIDTEKINEYLNIRLEQYEEKSKKGMTAEQESEFYSNIMEIVSLMDFTYSSMNLVTSENLRQVRFLHRLKTNK